MIRETGYLQRLNFISGLNSRRQRGQSMVFAMVFLAVVLIGVLVLFNTGQLTRQKMEVQNAADAAAYSAALLTARELNFMAYTNRAMVANEITFGQFSALGAWSMKYEMAANETASGYAALRGMTAPLNAVAPPVPLGTILGNILVKTISIPMKYYHNLNSRLVGVPMLASRLFRRILSAVLMGINKAYYGHQFMMRVTTMGTQLELVPEIIDRNAKGATLSNFGALALLLSSREQQQRMLKSSPSHKRFAALVNQSRDDWLTDRSRPDLQFPIDLNLGIMTIDASAGYQIYGGSELRLTDEKQGTYNWTHLDSVGFGLAGDVDVNFCLIPDPDGGCLFRVKFTLPLSIAQLSLGGAAQEFNIDKRSILSRVPSKWRGGGLYGGAWDNTPLAANEAVARGYRNPEKHYGLPEYTDIDPDNYPAIDKAPVILVGVRKNSHKLRTSDRIDEKPTPLTTGELALTTQTPGGPGTYEGEPGRVITGHINNQIDRIVQEYQQKLLDSYEDPTGLSAPIVESLIDSFRDDITDAITNELSPVFNSLLSPINASDDQGGMFALAAARVYFQNPNAGQENELGSTFSPYWEVRLQPVDDNVRKWAVLTQTLDTDSATSSTLQTTTPDPDSSGITPDSYTGQYLPLAVP